MKQMKSYRLGYWTLSNIEELKKTNPTLSETDIVEWAVALAYTVTEAWEKVDPEAFKLDDVRQHVQLNNRLIGK